MSKPAAERKQEAQEEETENGNEEKNHYFWLMTHSHTISETRRLHLRSAEILAVQRQQGSIELRMVDFPLKIVTKPCSVPYESTRET